MESVYKYAYSVMPNLIRHPEALVHAQKRWDKRESPMKAKLDVRRRKGGMYMQKITPHLWFDKEAVEAAKFYTSVFPKSKIKNTTTLHNTPSGSVDVVTIDLLGQEFMLISAGPLFKFNEAISFIIYCDTQKEIDYYWGKLSADPKAEQCGWVKDKYGLSWQIVPTTMAEMMKEKDQKKLARVTEAFLKMKKFDIAALKRAYEGVS